MKAVIVLCALVAVISAHPGGDKYDTKYDDTDYKEIMSNERLFKAYADCILEVPEARCTPEGKTLKAHIKDALETHCEKCSEKQKEAIRHVIKVLINEKPEYWNRVCKKYDPNGKFKAEYEKELKTL